MHIPTPNEFLAAGIRSASTLSARISLATMKTPGHPKKVNRKAKQKMAAASRRCNRTK